MKEWLLFTDGSVHPKSKVGYGAYLVVSSLKTPDEEVKSMVQIRRFENTSSTKLELETLLWALSEIQPFVKKLKIHTDSQNIIGLQERRGKIENRSAKSVNVKRLKNEDRYREFFHRMDNFHFEMVQMKGHEKKDIKTIKQSYSP